MDIGTGLQWSYIIPSAIGTALGAFGAYIGMRVDMAMLNTRIAADREHFGVRFTQVESSVKAAHDRIDRIVQAVHK